jgi:CTP:molybdopterin cytidylyltransferase MocA
MTRGQTPRRGRRGQVGAVVLAAGAATRFGSPKQHVLLPRVLERLAEAAVEDVVVVAGAYPLEAAGSARIVRCLDWGAGPGASLRSGLAALPSEAEAAVVVLADGPNLSPEAVDRVLQAWRDGDAPLVAASYNGDRGHPILVARDLWGSVPDEGLRAFEPVLVPCDDLGAPGDVDQPENLR